MKKLTKFKKNMKFLKENYNMNEIIIHNFFVNMNRQLKLFFSILGWILGIIQILAVFYLSFANYFGIYVSDELRKIILINFSIGFLIVFVRLFFGLVLAYFSHIIYEFKKIKSRKKK
jgi:hypothetical protein